MRFYTFQLFSRLEREHLNKDFVSMFEIFRTNISNIGRYRICDIFSRLKNLWKLVHEAANMENLHANVTVNFVGDCVRIAPGKVILDSFFENQIFVYDEMRSRQLDGMAGGSREITDMKVLPFNINLVSEPQGDYWRESLAL